MGAAGERMASQPTETFARRGQRGRNPASRSVWPTAGPRSGPQPCACGPAGRGRSARRSRPAPVRADRTPTPNRFCAPCAPRTALARPMRRIVLRHQYDARRILIPTGARCRAGARERLPPLPGRRERHTASTSVPCQLPTAGCTTMPAGLLITSRSASWYKMSSGIGSGLTADFVSRRDDDRDLGALPRSCDLLSTALEPADCTQASLDPALNLRSVSVRGVDLPATCPDGCPPAAATSVRVTASASARELPLVAHKISSNKKSEAAGTSDAVGDKVAGCVSLPLIRS